MACDIVIRSYQRDLDWLECCLRSIERYCTGFRDVVVVVPDRCRAWLERRSIPAGVRTALCPDYRVDYLGQQVTKLHADLLTDADHICHVDSDCIFTRPTSPADLFEDGRPRVRMAAYDDLDPHLPWQETTERFLGRPMPYEFMRRPPYTFPRWLYPALRDHAVKAHRMDVSEYVLAQPLRGFSEFNALAGYAYWRHRDSFEWCTDPDPDPPCRVYWSWGGLDLATSREIEALLA